MGRNERGTSNFDPGVDLAQHLRPLCSCCPSHENIDGSGYPDGLKGSQIPLEARSVHVTDAFDAITHVRPYKPARSMEWALEEPDALLRDAV